MRKYIQWRYIKFIILILVFWLFIQSFIIFNFSWAEENTRHVIEFRMSDTEGGFFGMISNFFNWGQYGPGEHGKAVIIPYNRKDEADNAFKIHQFNVIASNIMSLNRSLPDYRIEKCRTKKYPKNLPNTSIIIVFHNEAWSTLLRTVYSVINMSPHELIHEIILVDDASTFDHLKSPLEQYLSNISAPIKLYRMSERTGLIRARLYGAEKASGSSLLFLDAHCEAVRGWLQPLLYEISLNRRTVVAPIIDIINDKNFGYEPISDLTWGGLNWNMNFKWTAVPKRENDRRHGDLSLPIRTPTIAGGLFAIDRNFFYELGTYDEGMEIWGSENLEISLRTWMCHGQLLIAPCSRVGHVFRSASPYSWPGGINKIINKNVMRTVSVWMDQYKEFYMKFNPEVRSTDFGDISERLELRRKLKCRTFDWYLENIYPESTLPRSVLSVGTIRHDTTKQCLDKMNRPAGKEVGIISCHNQGGNQFWAFTTNGNIVSDELCLDGSVDWNGAVVMSNCDYSLPVQKFRYDFKTKKIHNDHKGQCLSFSSRSLSVSLEDCKLSHDQMWTLENYRMK